MLTRRGALAALAGMAFGNEEPFFLPPLKPAADGSRPWLWYAPVITGKYPNAATGWLFDRLRGAGFAICGIDAGEAYGSPAGRAVYMKAYEVLTRERSLSSRPCLLGQSRGALMLYNWAVEHPRAVSRIGGIYPVCDLRSYPGLARASGAYGMTESGLEQHLHEHNPIDRLAPLARERVPLLHLHGNADKTVPLEANSGELIRRYRALGGPAELVVVNGKGHEEIPEFFQSARLLEFFIQASGQSAFR
ncbi:MAG: prolyl oligopeptidase family serine peptidase [Acidobacteria bacterium]|nr:prolyl oligopeptidase family serine peptidase [Acidobacteriota bacterium]